MRVPASAANGAFVGCGWVAGLMPVLALRLLLLPIKLWRWAQPVGIDGAAQRARHRVRDGCAWCRDRGAPQPRPPASRPEPETTTLDHDPRARGPRQPLAARRRHAAPWPGGRPCPTSCFYRALPPLPAPA